MTSRTLTAAVALGLGVGLAGCAEQTQSVAAVAGGPFCDPPARPMVRLELLFGTSRSGAPPVGEAEWSDFLDDAVTPRFPAGLTVLEGVGQWRGSDGRIVREGSKVLVVWHEPDAGADADIEAIRAEYARRFGQESVMRVESVSCVSF